LKLTLTCATGRNPHKDFLEGEVNSRYPNILQDPQGYEKKAKQEDLPWSPPTQRQEELDH
jgi:hypothetical protein